MGGDPDCGHVKALHHPARSGLNGGKGGGDKLYTIAKSTGAEKCSLCGAKRIDRQIGIEATPQAYIDNLVAVFEEVRRVLRPDGTLWVNIGDSYCPGGKDPGSQMYRLRPDLTDAQVTYVMRELVKARRITDSTSRGRE